MGVRRAGSVWTVSALSVIVALGAGCAIPRATESDGNLSPSGTASLTQASATPQVPSAMESPSPKPSWDYSISWTSVPWTGRVERVAYDDQLGLWLALGWNEMWTSADGVAWERHAFICDPCDDEPRPDGTPWPAYMTGVARQGGLLWAVGVAYYAGDTRDLLLWTSSDGGTWTPIPQDEFVYSIATAIATNGPVLAVATGFFAVGSGAVLTSSNGGTWEEQQPGGTARVLDVHGDAERFVAVGFRGDESADFSPVIWVSPDGVDWTDVSPSGARGSLRSIVRASSGAYLAAGSDGEGSLVVWRSDSGIDWQSVPIDGPTADPNWPLVRLAASDESVALIADTAAGWASWGSENGTRWDEAGGFVGPTGPYLMSAELSGDKVVIFIGEGSQLWVGELSRTE